MIKDRYYYIVTGFEHDDQGLVTLICNENHALHSSRAKAETEIMNILDEIRADAVEMDYQFTYNLDRERGTLEVTYETGTVEMYYIIKAKLN